MLTTLVSIALLHWIVLVTPGANVLVVTSLAASGSRRAAFFAGLGVTAVAGIWSSLAILGVGAVFAAHPLLRQVVQIAGGVYLLYIAVRLWRSGTPASVGNATQLSSLAAFRIGFLTNIMNPKSALFFGSVFATSMPAHPPLLLLGMAVAVVLVNAAVWHTLLAVAFSHPLVSATYARHQAKLGRAAGVLVAVFGGRLLYSAAQELRTHSGSA
jgi:threonine efflux protein